MSGVHKSQRLAENGRKRKRRRKRGKKEEEGEEEEVEEVEEANLHMDLRLPSGKV